MQLNIIKSKVMHIARENKSATFVMLDPLSDTKRDLTLTIVEIDLGVIISQDLKPEKEVSKASSTANKILGLLKDAFIFREPTL